MNAISEMITQQVAGRAAGQMAQRLGISETTARTAVNLAVPLILAALARNAAQPQGAQDLHQAVTQDHDGSVLDNLMGTSVTLKPRTAQVYSVTRWANSARLWRTIWPKPPA